MMVSNLVSKLGDNWRNGVEFLMNTIENVQQSSFLKTVNTVRLSTPNSNLQEFAKNYKKLLHKAGRQFFFHASQRRRQPEMIWGQNQ